MIKFDQYKNVNIQAIAQLFANTFSDSEGETEGKLIKNLVLDLLTHSDKNEFKVFVASENQLIVGAVIFSKLTFPETDINALILSPLAIKTRYQGRGIGQKLINFAIEILKQDETEIIITYGDPNFYTKVGFQPITEQQIIAPLPLSFPEGWLGLPLTANNITSIDVKPICVQALNNPIYW